MNWLYYLLEANLYLSVFYLLYYLFLSRDTNYTLNRIYLLALSCLAFVIPLFQLGVLKTADDVRNAQAGYIIEGIVEAQLAQAPAAEYVLYNWPLYLYLTGVLIVTIVFGVKLLRLYRLSANQIRHKKDGYNLIYLNGENTAFSFFNYLFIGTKTADADTIIRHEQVHIRQKHSADILFTEILKAINWFNPVVYLLQKSLKTQHEYIADEQTAAAGNDNLSYSSFLVNNAYGAGGLSISNSFFNNKLLKKRIIMLNKQRSGKLARLKYLLAVPLCAGMLCASTLSFSKNYGVDLLPAKQLEQTMPNTEIPVFGADTNRIISATGIRKTDKSLKELFDHIAAHTLYSVAARDKRVTGAVVVDFLVDENGKLNDLKIVEGIGYGCDEQVIKSMKSFTGKINKPSQHYKLVVQFEIMDEKNNEVLKGKPAKPIEKSELVGDVVIVSYI